MIDGDGEITPEIMCMLKPFGDTNVGVYVNFNAIKELVLDIFRVSPQFKVFHDPEDFAGDRVEIVIALPKDYIMDGLTQKEIEFIERSQNVPNINKFVLTFTEDCNG